MAIGENIVSHFVKAKTPEMLVKKMRKLQAIEGIHLRFHDKQYADGFWYAWYEKEYRPKMDKELIKDKEGQNGIS